MLPTQMDMPPTRNIGFHDESQPQVYSLLASPNSPPAVKQQRRKKTSKLDDTIPVTINPQIARTPMGVTFAASHHRSTMTPESTPSFVPTHPINSNTFPHRHYIKPDSYDANNNINHNQIPPQAQQNPVWSNESLQNITANSMSQTNTQLQLLELNRLVQNSARTTPIPSTPRNEYDNLIRSLILTDQRSLLAHSHSFPSPPASIISSQKPKRKYSKRTHPPVPGKQEQVSHWPIASTQPTVSNHLPSVSIALARSEEHNLPMDMTTTSNFIPLTPPGSISSTKSPPTTINNESSFTPSQQYILPQAITNMAVMNQMPRQLFHDQRFNFAQKSINNLSPNNLRHLLTAADQHYYMVSSDSIPMAGSSILSETVNTMPAMSIPVSMKKERKKRGDGVGSKRKSKIVQVPVVQVLKIEQNMAYKSSKTEISTNKRQTYKDSNSKDIRTKTQLRRITRRNRLAVLKFMIRKRKQEQHERMSNAKLSDVKVEKAAEGTLPFVSAQVAKVEKMERSIADIIIPSLKISFDGNQKIESISLYYHRRCKPDFSNQNSLEASNNADNKLGLLIEALEFMETLNGSSKLTSGSVK